MNPRTTLVLALVAAALGAFVWFYQVEGEQRRHEAEARKAKLFPDVQPEDITALELTSSDGEAVRLERGESGWRVVKPVDFPADETTVSGMVDGLANLSSEAEVEEAQAPDVYGLGKDARVVRFQADGQTHVVRFGKATPVDYNTYARVDDDPEIHVVPTYRASAFERPLVDLRERRVLRFDRESIRSLSARWPGGGVELRKEDGAWKLVAPVSGPADERTVDDLLADLSFLRAESFVDHPSPEEEASLKEPAFEVVLRGQAEDDREAPTYRMVVGSGLPGAVRVVRGAEEGTLYRIPSERLDDLPRRVGAYRFRTLADFAAGDARRMELVFHPVQGEPLVVEAERTPNGWTSTPEPIAAGQAARLVTELSRLRAEDVEADAMGSAELAALGLSPPRVRIRVYGESAAAGEEGAEEGAAEEPAGGAEGAEAGAEALLADVAFGVYDPQRGIAAMRAGGDTVFRLDYELAEHIPISLEAFRNRFVSQEEPSAEPAGEGGEPSVQAPGEGGEPDAEP